MSRSPLGLDNNNCLQINYLCTILGVMKTELQKFTVRGRPIGTKGRDGSSHLFRLPPIDLSD